MALLTAWRERPGKGRRAEEEQARWRIERRGGGALLLEAADLDRRSELGQGLADVA
jgi:hypothetical protein